MLYVFPCTFPPNSCARIKSVVICCFSTGALTDIRSFTHLWLCYFLTEITKNQTCFQLIPWCPVFMKEQGTHFSGALSITATVQTWTMHRLCVHGVVAICVLCCSDNGMRSELSKRATIYLPCLHQGWRELYIQRLGSVLCW